MGRKKMRGWTTRIFTLLVILGLIALNSYAYLELGRLTNRWVLSLVPGSISTQIAQLALILAINNVVIVYLLLTRR